MNNWEYKHLCYECGEVFFSMEPLDSLCDECMDELGFHEFENDGEEDNDEQFGF